MIDIKQLRDLAARWQSEADAQRQQFGEAGANEAIAKASAGPELLALLDKMAEPIGWESVVVSAKDGNDDTRRLAVPGGWLYQVAHHAFVDPVESRPGYYMHGWHPPVFVPEPKP